MVCRRLHVGYTWVKYVTAGLGVYVGVKYITAELGV